MEWGDAACFLRTGYEVIGGNNGNRRGKVQGFTALSADMLWDDGETETVDQFGHTLNVLDGGPPPVPPYFLGETEWCGCRNPNECDCGGYSSEED